MLKSEATKFIESTPYNNMTSNKAARMKINFGPRFFSLTKIECIKVQWKLQRIKPDDLTRKLWWKRTIVCRKVVLSRMSGKLEKLYHLD